MQKKTYTHTELMLLAIEEMRKSKPDHSDKLDPKVGAVLVSSQGELLGVAHRGELRKGDHAEFTLFERKLAGADLSDCILYTTLEPCVERNHPKCGCSFRAINARVGKVVIGHPDPDPTVAGQGAELLESEKITVEYFDKDFKEIIAKENAEYFKEKEELAKRLHKTEVSPLIKPLEYELSNFQLSDFSEEAQQEMITLMELPYKLGSPSFTSFLNQFGFIKTGRKGTIPRPTGLGLLMLGKTPQLHFPQARVKFTIHRNGQEPIIKDFDGALVLMPGKVEEYLDLIISTEINREHFHRVELSDIPKKALREVIINGIVHRDYSLEGYRIMVDMYNDRVEVSSPGIPMFSLEKFYAFSVPSVSKNQKIAYIFNQMHLVEERGLGMKELKALKDIGNPPDFKFNDNYFITIIHRSKKKVILGEVKPVISEEGVIKISNKEIISFIRERGKISSGDFVKQFNINRKSAQRQLNKMVDDGILDREGEKKGRKFFLKEGLNNGQDNGHVQ